MSEEGNEGEDRGKPICFQSAGTVIAVMEVRDGEGGGQEVRVSHVRPFAGGPYNEWFPVSALLAAGWKYMGRC